MIRRALVLLVFISQPLLAADSIPRRVLRDFEDQAKAPLRWTRKEWTRFAAGATLVGAALTLDDELRRVAQRNTASGTQLWSDRITPLGGGTGQKIALATLLAGVLRRDTHWRDTGLEALEAHFWASTVVTPLVKRVTGRSRPNGGDDDSFPSGHATSAFALASVYAARSDNRIVPVIAYTAASAVAAARVHDDVHYLSDVVAGALIGRAVGLSLVSRHRKGKPTSFVIVPHGRGFLLHMRY